MKGHKQRKLVPRLRFPEFRDVNLSAMQFETTEAELTG